MSFIDNQVKRQSLIYSLSQSEILSFVAAKNLPSYRASQIWQWLYKHKVQTWEEMSNLPKQFKEELEQNFVIQPLKIKEVFGDKGDTQKILAELHDTETIEFVLLPSPHGRTLCISSQAGCRFNCAFCASGKSGFSRNLETGEIIGQVILSTIIWEQPPTHIVFMGIGEPLDNYENVMKAVRIINDPAGLNIGARHITISTCGIIPGILRLAEEGIQIELSVSLHASNDKTRNKLMPINKTYPLKELLATCENYSKKTKRIITFEYTLIKNLNDKPEDAANLANLLKSKMARVNLIPLSPVDEFAGSPPSEKSMKSFIYILEKQGINTTLRNSKGTNLKAACGQLRWKKKHE